MKPPIAAGSVPLDYHKFARAAYPGAILWASVYVGLGYYTGDRWEQVALLVRSHLTTAAAVGGAAAAVYVIARFATRSRA